MIKIEDNFLGWDVFNKLQSQMICNGPDEEGKFFQFPWTYIDAIDYYGDKDKFQFVHTFYNEYAPISPLGGVINPILEKLKITLL